MPKLMLLLGYFIIGHPNWKGATIEVYVTLEDVEAEKDLERMNELID